MTQKEGRMPYDPEIPRVPLYEPVREAPEGRKSIQKVINTGPNGTINEARYNKYIEIITAKGFKKIPFSDIYGVASGTRVAYLTVDKKWRSGGFLVSVHNSNTLYGTDKKLDHYKLYFAYKGFNKALFHVQEEDVAVLWVKFPKQDNYDVDTIIGNKIKLKRPNYNKPTKFPIQLFDSYGNLVVVKYARDEHDRKRFTESSKYKKIEECGWEFDDE
jgi:hypothetical protein